MKLSVLTFTTVCQEQWVCSEKYYKVCGWWKVHLCWKLDWLGLFCNCFPCGLLMEYNLTNLSRDLSCYISVCTVFVDKTWVWFYMWEEFWKSVLIYGGMSPRAHFHVVRMLRFMFTINQPSSSTPFHSVLVSISVFMTLLIVFYAINSPDNSPFSRFVHPVLSLPYWSFQPYISKKISFSTDIIPGGWLGSKHQLTI